MRLLATASAALAIVLSGMVAAPAETLEFRLGRDGPELRLRDNDRCDPRYERCAEVGRSMRRDMRRDERRVCSDGRALNKAENMGVERARVHASGRRTIEIRGRSDDGGRVSLLFGRDGSCPLLN